MWCGRNALPEKNDRKLFCPKRKDKLTQMSEQPHVRKLVHVTFAFSMQARAFPNLANT